jgi:hypothetical protein
LSSADCGAILASVAMFSAGCSTPIQLSDDHVTSGRMAPSLDLALLACAR